MKMKRLLIVISMLAVMFSLSGCDDKKDKPFDYDETQIALDTVYLFNEYSKIVEDDKFVDYYMTDGTEFEKSAIDGINQAVNNDKVGRFEDFSKYINSATGASFVLDDVEGEVVDNDDSVSVTIVNKAKERNVEITVKYVENADYYIQYEKLSHEINVASITNEINNYYGFSVEDFLAQTGYPDVETIVAESIESSLQQQEIYPYIPEEMVVVAKYSKTELMKQAGMNTLIGMGTVFIVLIFISFIISLFKFLPALLAPRPSVPEAKDKPSAPAPSAPASAAVSTGGSENLMDDSELVAVITAAIYAASASGGSGAQSKDKLIVRSIRRANK